MSNTELGSSVQADDEEERGNNCDCLDCINPKTDIEGSLTALALLCMSCGLAIMCVGYLVPRDYVFDPSKSAREMEKIEIYYANLSFYLDTCIVAGMAFIAVGGLISSALFMYYFVIDSRQVYRKEDRLDLNLLDVSQHEMVSYGSASDR